LHAHPAGTESVQYRSSRAETTADTFGLGLAEKRMIIRAFIAAFVLGFTTVSQAQVPNTTDGSAAEMVELLGAPVFAWDGSEVGKVLDVLFDDEGQPLRLRMKGAANLGLGERTIEVPKGTFILLRGAAVLELPAEAVEVLPEINDDASEE